MWLEQRCLEWPQDRSGEKEICFWLEHSWAGWGRSQWTDHSLHTEIWGPDTKPAGMAEVFLFWKQEGRECMRPHPTFNAMLAGMICRNNSYQHGVSKRQDTGLAFGILLSSAGFACLRVRRRKHASFRNRSEAQTRHCVLGIGSIWTQFLMKWEGNHQGKRREERQARFSPELGLLASSWPCDRMGLSVCTRCCDYNIARCQGLCTPGPEHGWVHSQRKVANGSRAISCWNTQHRPPKDQAALGSHLTLAKRGEYGLRMVINHIKLCVPGTSVCDRLFLIYPLVSQTGITVKLNSHKGNSISKKRTLQRFCFNDK